MDIDIRPEYGDNVFEISLGNNRSSVGGNVALLNRFQITFFDEGFLGYSEDGDIRISDNFGGKAFSSLGTPRSLSDDQSLSASVRAAINNTVDSIKESTGDTVPPEERLVSASLVEINKEGDKVSIVIEIVPEVVQTSTLPRFFVPVISE